MKVQILITEWYPVIELDRRDGDVEMPDELVLRYEAAEEAFLKVQADLQPYVKPDW